MIDSLLSALGYVGDSLAKPGRAVRGVLGGRPEEALAAIPFSDALGLTDQSNAVSGHDLVSRLGLGDGPLGSVAGFAADIATDPLTYLGAGLAKHAASNMGRLTGLGGVSKVAKAAEEPGVFSLLSDNDRAIHALQDAPIPTMGSAARPVRPVVTPEGFNPIQEANYPFPKPPFDESSLKLAKFADPGVPTPGNFAHEIGLHPEGYYDPASYGIVSDAIQEGASPHLISQLGLGGWDSALSHLKELGGAARAPDAWSPAIKGRLGDLDAASKIAQASPSAAVGQLDRITEQQNRLYEILGIGERSSVNSPAREGVRDLQGVLVPIGESADHLLPHTAHLGIGPQDIKRFAAAQQRKEIDARVRNTLGLLSEDGGLPNSADDIINSYNPDYLRQELTHMLFPANRTHSNFEPNIVRQYFNNPPEDLAAAIQAARDARTRVIREANSRPREF